MSMVTEYRINSGRFVDAPSLLQAGKNVYESTGLVAAYELVYNMFPDIPLVTVEKVLNGTIPAYARGKCVIIFLDSEGESP